MARSRSIGSGIKWTDQLNSILDEYVEQEKEIADRIFREVAKETAEDLRHTSPRRKNGTGEYAEGWEVVSKESGVTSDSMEYVVCNPKHYRLTHLLEKGHQTRNQYGGPYKRTKAIKHIKPAEIKGNEKLVKRLEEKL